MNKIIWFTNKYLDTLAESDQGFRDQDLLYQVGEDLRVDCQDVEFRWMMWSRHTDRLGAIIVEMFMERLVIEEYGCAVTSFLQVPSRSPPGPNKQPGVIGGAAERAPFLECQFVRSYKRCWGCSVDSPENPSQSIIYIMTALVQEHTIRVWNEEARSYESQRWREKQSAGKLLETAPGARQGPTVPAFYSPLPSLSNLSIERIFEEQVFFRNVICPQFKILKFENIWSKKQSPKLSERHSSSQRQCSTSPHVPRLKSYDKQFIPEQRGRCSLTFWLLPHT